MIYLKVRICNLLSLYITGVIKDYFIAYGIAGGDSRDLFWCSSSSMIFSALPKCTESAEDLAKLGGINNFFTGEFDSVLFPGSGAPKVIDDEMGITLPPKPITELDRLSYVVNQIRNIWACPKGLIKYTPAEKLARNEAFKGLSREDAFQLTSW